MSDLISRQAAIDALDTGCELLRRVLDNTDVVGVERAKYEWSLGLIESCIADMKALPSAEPEIIYCKDCKHVGTDATCCLVCNREGMGLRPYHVYHDDYCSYAERRTNET